jgi:hypothetical protein
MKMKQENYARKNKEKKINFIPGPFVGKQKQTIGNRDNNNKV